MVNNNYVFQRLLSTFDLSRNHDLTNKVFELGGQRQELNKSIIKSWRTHDEMNRNYRAMPDDALKIFIDGIQQAGKDGLIVIHINNGEWP